MKKTLSLVLALAMICAAAAAMAAPVEIDYWSVFTGGDGATMQAMVDEFNASQDEVHVNHTPMTADDLYQKIPLTVQTGTGIPDVTVVHIERIPDFVEKELLYSYDMDLLAEAGIVPENYNASAWERSDIDGEHYGIPLDVHSYVTYYNKDLFDKYELNEYVEDGSSPLTRSARWATRRVRPAGKAKSSIWAGCVRRCWATTRSWATRP